jgi:integrase
MDTRQSIHFADRTYSNFINSLKSDETKIKYDFCIKNFMTFVDQKDYSALLKINVEERIIDYILQLRKLKLSSNTIRTRVASIYHFYAMNDVILNKTKINKYHGEFRKVVKDRPYTHEEIHKLLDVADLRMKVCILLMCGAGLRLGAIPDLKMKHLERIDNLYKITVYENSNQEYTTYCTAECSNFIDEYIKYRERNGENITSESYLIRDHFDDYAPLSVKQKARPITKHTIREIIAKLLVKSGTRQVREVHLTHGFRKFFTNQLFEADLKTEYRWSLEGHKLKGNDPYYVRISEKLLLEQYQKGTSNLIVNEEFRLKRKVETLMIEKSRVDKLEEKIRRIEKMYQK